MTAGECGGENVHCLMPKIGYRKSCMQSSKGLSRRALGKDRRAMAASFEFIFGSVVGCVAWVCLEARILQGMACGTSFPVGSFGMKSASSF